MIRLSTTPICVSDPTFTAIPEWRWGELERLAITVRERTLALVRPADVGAFLQDPTCWTDVAGVELAPYWAHLWPASLLLGDLLLEVPIAYESRWLVELGCGLGLAGIAALAAGWNVVFSDLAPHALELVRASVNANAIPPRRYRIEPGDWSRPGRGQVQDIIAADILYETELVPRVFQVLECQLALGGVARIVDPGRRTADAFASHAMARGWACTTRELGVETDALGCLSGRLFTVQRPVESNFSRPISTAFTSGACSRRPE